eukprot:CAMPEP_0206575724 /NCGR_PEP_ID=MMETSP0325_2-20121206/30270_1 /ASSEMBLY_ACC=CAM_ASM_000347 /TAXON_ID=2866 /ORGANISM="Crypthecodinium cohnii, Strain Seligo" /LENGTH=82 /DNA_ID=CAMNT_0054080691 /DNA_START=312 /DNA_END=560 /DNA_ORIENTATION=-
MHLGPPARAAFDQGWEDGEGKGDSTLGRLQLGAEEHEDELSVKINFASRNLSEGMPSPDSTSLESAGWPTMSKTEYRDDGRC